MVTAKSHGHESRGLRHREQNGDIAAAVHGEKEDLELTSQVAIYVYSLLILWWSLACARGEVK
jgi:hypothetical protein